MRGFAGLLLGLIAANGLLADEPRILLLIGPPGSGKGTQAAFITRTYGLPPVSTGDLLRAEVKAGTGLGQRIAPTLAQGGLVSDEIVNTLVAERLTQPDAARGIILDGYPRTLAQARYLDALLERRGLPPVTVLHLDVPEEEAIRRLQARGRPDDKAGVIRDRLKVYARDTAPILTHYAGRRYHRIDGAGSPEEVFTRIQRALAREP